MSLLIVALLVGAVIGVALVFLAAGEPGQLEE
jgi:hypothetical protein